MPEPKSLSAAELQAIARAAAITADVPPNEAVKIVRTLIAQAASSATMESGGIRLHLHTEPRAAAICIVCAEIPIIGRKCVVPPTWEDC